MACVPHDRVDPGVVTERRVAAVVALMRLLLQSWRGGGGDTNDRKTGEEVELNKIFRFLILSSDCSAIFRRTPFERSAKTSARGSVLSCDA